MRIEWVVRETNNKQKPTNTDTRRNNKSVSIKNNPLGKMFTSTNETFGWCHSNELNGIWNICELVVVAAFFLANKIDGNHIWFAFLFMESVFMKFNSFYSNESPFVNYFNYIRALCFFLLNRRLLLLFFFSLVNGIHSKRGCS